MFKSSLCLILFLVVLSFRCQEKEPIRKPNVIILYADDLGYGDLSSYGATSISTPHMDRIAHEGVKFTQGYATSATCTPSRYALLTGMYPWRNKRAKVLPGNAPLIIDSAMTTLPDQFKKGGYQTSVIGKWHLGLGGENLDWNGPIVPGPNDLGFDYSFVLASTNDRSPTVYVENDRVVGLSPSDPLEVSYLENFEGEPTGETNPELLTTHPSHGHDMSINNGISRIGYMRGGKSAMWVDEDMGDTLLYHSLKFIRENKDQPFFLFFAFPQIHVPRTPHPRFQGKTDLGPRGDYIIEMDYAVGQVLNTLEELGIDDNTLIVFSSDNGPVLDDGYEDQAVELNGVHTASGPLRGGKYSLFDAGTHVPFMARWPGTIAPRISDALISQVDLYASLSALIDIPSGSMDSQNLKNVLLGQSQEGRSEIILEGLSKLIYRQGNMVMIPPYEGPAMIPWGPKIESGNSNVYQLYNLEQDPGQVMNLADGMPDELEEMKRQFELHKKAPGL